MRRVRVAALAGFVALAAVNAVLVPLAIRSDDAPAVYTEGTGTPRAGRAGGTPDGSRVSGGTPTPRRTGSPAPTVVAPAPVPPSPAPDQPDTGTPDTGAPHAGAPHAGAPQAGRPGRAATVPGTPRRDVPTAGATTRTASAVASAVDAAQRATVAAAQRATVAAAPAETGDAPADAPIRVQPMPVGTVEHSQPAPVDRPDERVGPRNLRHGGPGQRSRDRQLAHHRTRLDRQRAHAPAHHLDVSHRSEVADPSTVAVLVHRSQQGDVAAAERLDALLRRSTHPWWSPAGEADDSLLEMALAAEILDQMP
ncbi:MAG TPA: hypothetical protein VK453_16705 [Micromonosporaceae bacterium]|nr:hypothetical protein [Micromonosporaceae bacterium]